ncbi:MAG: outer membrane lipoprotein carrier protein LolA [Candidatus Bipolaricaulota bacterium]|nr:outer membrane lipoprotein carrier protein LolA [Candidatus Bipolaricaulota bacterium]
MNIMLIRKAVWLGAACLALAALAAGAQTLTSANEVLDRLRANATAIETLQARIVVQTYKDGQVNLIQEMRLYLEQPDKMRQEYVAPDYMAGNMALIVGDAMLVYIAANETWHDSKLSDLSTAEQPWLLFRQLLRDVQDEFNDYGFTLAGLDGGKYHLVGNPETDDAVYGSIELWIDPETFVPTRRLLYDVDGNLIADVRIQNVVEVAPGIFLARRVEAYDANGVLRNEITYQELVANEPLDPALFVLPAEATNG